MGMAARQSETHAARRQPRLANERRALGWLCLLAVLTGGCHDDMYDQPRCEPLERSAFFPDLRSARPKLDGTIPFGTPLPNPALNTGRADGELVTQLPVELNAVLLQRGRQRFDIFCSPCHGRTGDGTGMIVQRGYRQPPTYHSDRLRGAAVGHVYDVITNGFGAMPSYASQVPVADRWAIVAYLRALQLSRHAQVEELPGDLQSSLDATPREGTP